MNANDLQHAYMFSAALGIKMLVYGDPGTGKTPLATTAPRPVMLLVEPGARSLSQSYMPCYAAYDATTDKGKLDRINQFFDWCTKSREMDNFDTICIDSVSMYAEIALSYAEATVKDGRAVYGAVLDEVMPKMRDLFYMKNKHIYLIAKRAMIEVDKKTITRPLFPGKALNAQIPHLYDEILYLEKVFVPGQAEATSMWRTRATPSILARDRSGKLAEYEPPDLTQLIAKAMS